MKIKLTFHKSLIYLHFYAKFTLINTHSCKAETHQKTVYQCVHCRRGGHVYCSFFSLNMMRNYMATTRSDEGVIPSGCCTSSIQYLLNTQMKDVAFKHHLTRRHENLIVNMFSIHSVSSFRWTNFHFCIKKKE